jgi:hypothetical protein
LPTIQAGAPPDQNRHRRPVSWGSSGLLLIGIVSGYGFAYVMVGIAAMLAIAAFAVNRIGEETRGLALDTIAPITE